MFRVFSSWARSPRVGLIGGIVGSSILFTAVYGSTDLYTNVWHLVLWSCLAIIIWRTGGLETAIVLHAILNTFLLLAAPLQRIDLGAALSDRSAGVGTRLIPTAVVIVITAVIWFWDPESRACAHTPMTTGTRQGPWFS